VNKEERRESYRLKNERRRNKSNTLHAEIGREGRRLNDGAFGKADPATFNKLAEGTTAMRRPETEQLQ
jgi:hypothetical protein